MGKLTITILRANDLKNMELVGKSDPYVVVHIRPLFKVKTKVVDNNLNPVWNETFELIAEDKETQSLILEVLISFLSVFVHVIYVVLLNACYLLHQSLLYPSSFPGHCDSRMSREMIFELFCETGPLKQHSRI